MCTGRIDPAMVAQALKKGLDGLLIVGCYFGDCHYISGNLQAQVKIDLIRLMLKHIGVNEERVSARQCSSGEAAVFVKIVKEFDEKVRDLGPIGEGGDYLKAPEIFQKLQVTEVVLAGEKMRWLIGKKIEFLESGNKYGEIFTEHEFKRSTDMILVEEIEVQELLTQLQKGPRSVKNLAKELAIPPARVFRYITALNRKKMVTLEKISGQSPLYRCVSQEV